MEAVHEDQKLRATLSPERHHSYSTPARSNSFAQEGLHIGHRKHPTLQGCLFWKQGNHTPECQSQCCHQLHKPVRAAMAWRLPVLPTKNSGRHCHRRDITGVAHQPAATASRKRASTSAIENTQICRVAYFGSKGITRLNVKANVAISSTVSQTSACCHGLASSRTSDQKARATLSPERHHRCSTPARSNSYPKSTSSRSPVFSALRR